MTYMSLIAKEIPEAEQTLLIQNLKKEILALISPVRIVLLGSASRQQMTEHSDLDVIVIVADGTDIKRSLKALARLSVQVNWPVDVLVYDQRTYAKKALEGGICQIAEEEGLELFASS